MSTQPHPGVARRLAPLAVFSLIGAILLAAYVLTIDGMLDPTGHALGRDFVNYWTAGRLAAGGRAAEIFDPAAFLAAERALLHPDLAYHFWSYPPTALLVVWPLGYLGYVPALVVWSIAGLAALWLSARSLFGDGMAAGLLLFAPAVVVNLAFGQNGAFTAALLIGGLAVFDRRPVLAGILFGLLIFKPHLGLLLPVAVLAAGRWTTFWTAAATAGLAVAASILVFGIEPWTVFFDRTLPEQTRMMDSGIGPFLWMMTSAFAAGRVLGLTGEAIWLQLPFLAFGAWAVWIGFRSHCGRREKAAIFFLATFVASPQGFSYDLIPAAAAALIFLARPEGARWAWAVWALPLAGMVLAAMKLPIAPLVLSWALWEALRAGAAKKARAGAPVYWT